MLLSMMVMMLMRVMRKALLMAVDLRLVVVQMDQRQRKKVAEFPPRHSAVAPSERLSLRWVWRKANWPAPAAISRVASCLVGW